ELADQPQLVELHPRVRRIAARAVPGDELDLHVARGDRRKREILVAPGAEQAKVLRLEPPDRPERPVERIADEQLELLDVFTAIRDQDAERVEGRRLLAFECEDRFLAAHEPGDRVLLAVDRATPEVARRGQELPTAFRSEEVHASHVLKLRYRRHLR